MNKDQDFYIIITAPDWDHLRKALLTPDGKENAAVLFCGVSESESERRLLVRRFKEVPPDHYHSRKQFHLEVSPHFYNEVVTECEQSRLTPVIIHSHPFDGDAWYSGSDDHGESRLLPVLSSLLPETTPASLVITKTSVTGRQFAGGRFCQLTGLKIFGGKSQIIEFRADKRDAIDTQYDRQVRAVGEVGQRLIQKIKVGVIGVGGIGSLVVEQLARVGIKDLMIIDDDVIEPSNVSRILGSTTRDIGRSKVEIVGAHARSLGVTNLARIAESALKQDVLLQLRDRDLIINCVDNDRSRAIINRFSYQYLIPAVDLGMRLDGRDGNIKAGAGRISIIGSGMACLRCSHHLNPERIRAESMPSKERYALEREGYVIGINDPAPAVISINTVVAGLGVTAALNLFVGLTGAKKAQGQIYDTSSGTVFTTTERHEAGCDICDPGVGIKALGDLQIVSAY